MAELEQLIAEQEADDTDTIRPEFRDQVPFTAAVASHIGMDTDGEIVYYLPRPPRGTLLVGGAAYHGTYAGYAREGCRCEPCKTAKREYMRRKRAS